MIFPDTQEATTYTGRFAPSPTGPLHFGSLIAALASYLDAKAHNGHWIVRIEDIDQPRCVEGADQQILECLIAHGLKWDGEIRYQSGHLEEYNSVLNQLANANKLYGCQCTRKQIKAGGGVYRGTCRDLHLPMPGNALRLRAEQTVNRFHDLILGDVIIDDPHALEDTVLRRRDGLHSYNLVVVIDDILQGVNHVLRGSDLLSTTAAHLTLYEALGVKPPRYAHIPVAATTVGRKLSKQNHAKALNNQNALGNLQRALAFLGLADQLSPEVCSVNALIDEAVSKWHYKYVPKHHEIIVDEQESSYHSDPDN